MAAWLSVHGEDRPWYGRVAVRRRGRSMSLASTW